MSGCAELPRYKCHKEVWALEIAGVKIAEDGSARVRPRDLGYGIFTTRPGWADHYKGSDSDLGYLVIYQDGYESWSPSKAFKNGYSRTFEAKSHGSLGNLLG